VGVVLYEALTGALPFSAPSPVALIGKVLSTSAPPPQSLNPDIPPALASLVMRLLAKQPDERPASAHVLGGLLAELA
jgi:serine/threonine-protein kinase